MKNLYLWLKTRIEAFRFVIIHYTGYRPQVIKLVSKTIFDNGKRCYFLLTANELGQVFDKNAGDR